MSALPLKVDIRQRNCDVRFVPKADKVQRSKELRYSITSFARARLYAELQAITAQFS
jgi:hypothetical protein